jgi:23S rRNA (uracil1939-C5)-methyltransferase
MKTCQYQGVCTGCDLLHLEKNQQIELKKQNLLDHWRSHVQIKVESTLPEIQYLWIDDSGLRDRVDFMLNHDSEPRFGLFGQDRRTVVDLESCLQMSDGMSKWYQLLRQNLPKVAKASIRLRIGPGGLRGVWLDLPNIDVKRLIDEKTALENLMAIGIVEIGQRRKRLVKRETGELKLVDPILEAWFQTYSGQKDHPIQLYSTIGSFSQVGHIANKALVKSVMGLVSDINYFSRELTKASTKNLATELAGCESSKDKLKRSSDSETTHSRISLKVAEFGCGNGNFTLPLASLGANVHAFEVDALALDGLIRSASEAKLSEKIVIHKGDYQSKKSATVDFSEFDLLLVDPPRSGLGQFADRLIENSKIPNHLIYISCFPESFASDAAKLIERGYELRSWKIIDQFPQTSHYEVVAKFELLIS